ncbi:MAG TPA: NB-ARC domain-containing protein, partial [Planctomycetaceae bacterium]|nr:NB-ARC domain-containing protein [Planctomycetaceae bacterium]
MLKQLRDAFLTTVQDGIANIQALTGLGGVGKTQIAVEYVYRHQADYQNVFWINAASQITIDAGILEIATLLEFPKSGLHDKAFVANGVLQWLATNSAWLLVLDNADEPDLLQTLIAGNRHGHYLVTSRQSVLDGLGVVCSMPIGVMNDKEATGFLLKRANRLQTTGQELEAVKSLAEELGRLPLALEQAGSYILSRTASYSG